MPVKVTPRHDGKVMKIEATGTLSRDDYHGWIPAVEQMIEKHGKIRILFLMSEFHGWSAGGLWEDIKFDVKHFRDIERLAMVGESRWQKGMATFCKPFTTAEIRYFDTGAIDDAWQWIEEGLPSATRS